MPTAPLSLKDLARELQVSPSLVSKVLNGRLGTSRVSPELSHTIQARAAELGYHKNRTAAALAAGRHGVLGVFLHQVGVRGSGIIEELIAGIASAATRRQQRLWLTFFQNEEEFLRQCPQTHAGEVDGLIVGGVSHPKLARTLLRLQAAGVPVVTIHDDSLDARLANVACDQELVMRLATEHLLDRGCRRLAHLGPTGERRAGFIQALRERGLEPIPELILDTDYEYATGRLTVERLLARGLSFDGLTAQSDLLALGAMEALQHHGLSVPRQVRVVGVDDSPLCDYCPVPLTSVSQNFRRRGEMAVELMLRRIGHQDATAASVTPTLHIRQSTC
jgi:LacI family transcriptional regulator